MEDLNAALPSEREVMEAKPSVCVHNDIPLLMDERFDFDISLSPMSENEDEVFLRPMGHEEKCIAVMLESQEGPKKKTSPPALGEPTWSPLDAEKFVEIHEQAHLVVLQLQRASKTKRKNAGEQEEARSATVEKFVQESKSKRKILERGIVPKKTPTSIKRETFYVGESPVSQLPPSLQKCSSHPAKVTEGSHRPQRLLNASRPGQLDKLPKTSVMHSSQPKSDKGIKKPSTFQPVKNAPGNNNSITTGQSLLVGIGLDKTPIGVDKIVIQRCENKPLIDLFNTPEVIKAVPIKPTGRPIDLSSPLIQLGPEGNKENIDYPLLKF